MYHSRHGTCVLIPQWFVSCYLLKNCKSSEDSSLEGHYTLLNKIVIYSTQSNCRGPETWEYVDVRRSVIFSTISSWGCLTQRSLFINVKTSCSTASETKAQIEIPNTVRKQNRTKSRNKAQVNRSQTPNHIYLQGD